MDLAPKPALVRVRVMKSDKPFRKSFICGAVLYAGKAIILIAARVQNLSHWLGYALPSCLLAAIFTGIWAHFSKKSWSWLRFSLTVFVLHFVLATIAVSGERLRHARESAGPVLEIERKTFSVSLPGGWKERKLDFGDPDFVASFDCAASCAFTVLVRPKSDEVSAAAMLDAQRKPVEKGLADAKSTALATWGQYQGKGLEIEGTIKGAIFRARLFGFENNGNACVVSEMASLSDYKAYADDFETIRRTFRLK